MSKHSESAACAGVCPCASPCPIGEALRMIGGKWKLRILCTLSVDGTQRYNDLVRKTAGVTNAMLSSSLKELEADGSAGAPSGRFCINSPIGLPEKPATANDANTGQIIKLR